METLNINKLKAVDFRRGVSGMFGSKHIEIELIGEVFKLTTTLDGESIEIFCNLATGVKRMVKAHINGNLLAVAGNDKNVAIVNMRGNRLD